MNKVWLKNYYPKVPHEIPTSDNSLVDDFFENCKKYKDKTAFENMGVKLSFGELEELAKLFAGYLQKELKLKKGDRIAIMMPNLLQYPIAMFGSLMAGLIVVNVNPLFTARELKYLVEDSEIQAILILENFAHVLAEVEKDVKVKHVIVTKFGDMFPFVKKHLANFVVKYIKKMVPKYSLEDYSTFTEVLECEYKNTPVPVNQDDIAFLQYTGGTTGKSKGAILTHKNLVSNVLETTAWIESAVEEGEEVIITALPLYHIFSLLANCFTYMRVGGNNVLITNPKDIPNFIKYIKNRQFTAITGVNTLFNALIKNEEFKEVNFDKLKLVLGGGMAVHESTAIKWKEITGRPIIEAYGLTEASPAVCINPILNMNYNGSIGLPISSTEVSIRDEDGNELEVEEVGELWVKGPQVMKGYWKKEEETKTVLTDDGWLKTGDIAKVDKEGFVFLIDRKKDMIIISGFNVYPNEVEDVLSQMPGIVEVAIVGVPDEAKGEAVKAFIVAEHPLEEEEILEFCKTRLTPYKIPHQFEFRDELPKTNVGKILRKVLRENNQPSAPNS